MDYGTVRICKNPPVDYQSFRHVNDKTNVVERYTRKSKRQASNHANDFNGKANAYSYTNGAVLMEQSKNWWKVSNIFGSESVILNTHPVE